MALEAAKIEDATQVSINRLLEQVQVGRKTVLDLTGTPGDRKLTVTSQKVNPEPPLAPTRTESLARNHRFYAARALGDYLLRYGGKGSVVYADQPAGTIYAVLDEAAEQGREVVTCVPHVHPLWAPWAQVAGKDVPLEAFAELVSRHRRSITKPTGRDLVFLLSQVTVAVSVQVQKGRGRESINGLMITTSVEGRQQTEAQPFPDAITVRAPLFVGQPAFDVELDLTVHVNADGDVKVGISAGTVDEARERAFESMVDLLREQLKPLDAVITLGAPQQRSWEYLKA